jgi:serine/threonine-protein kinase
MPAPENAPSDRSGAGTGTGGRGSGRGRLAQSPAELKPGVTIARRYELIEPIGRGAMGSVWKARHKTLDYAVACKFLTTLAPAAEEAAARFEQEARLSAKLGEACPHIVRVFDYGVLKTGTPYLVMEYLAGEDFATHLRRAGRLPVVPAARLVMQLCRALQVAHRERVVHRDLKPANMFLCPSGEGGDPLLKLLDFGVAKAFDLSADAYQTRDGFVVGTPSYMSPEQLDPTGGRPVDARSDLWALGAIFYLALTGELPFGRGTVRDVVVRVLTTEPAPATSLNPSLPPGLDAWFARAFAKDPAHRFQSAQEVSDSLSAFAGTSDASLSINSAWVPQTVTETASVPVPVVRQSKRRFGAAALGAGAGLSALVAAAALGRLGAPASLVNASLAERPARVSIAVAPPVVEAARPPAAEASAAPASSAWPPAAEAAKAPGAEAKAVTSASRVKASPSPRRGPGRSPGPAAPAERPGPAAKPNHEDIDVGF